MNKKTRFVILYALVFIFLFIGSYILISAQGFIFDIKNLKITKTGGLFLKFSPADAKIFINGKEHSYSPGLIINNGTLIKKLLPGEYEIKIIKDNFKTWEKTLTIQPGLVTTESQINLWPENLKETFINKNVSDFWNTKKGPVYQDIKGNLYLENSKIKGKNIISSSEKSNLLITAEANNKFLINLNNPKTAINIEELFNSLKQHQLSFPGFVPIKEVVFHPFSEEKLIILTNNSIYSLDTRKIELERLAIIDDFISTSANNNEIFALDSKGKLLILNLVLKNKNYFELNIDSPIKIKVSQNNNLFFILDKKNDLTLYNRETKDQTLIASNVNEIELYQDEKRMIFVNHANETFIYFLEDYQGDTKELKNSFFKLNLNHKNLENITWLNDKNYFLAVNNNNLLINEIDKRLPINSYEIYKEIKKYFLQKKELYILKENNELIRINLE